MKATMRKKLIPILFHLIPLFPLSKGWWSATLAALILVVVPYIKVRKLELELRDGKDSLSDKEKSSLLKTIRFWKSLTLVENFPKPR